MRKAVEGDSRPRHQVHLITFDRTGEEAQFEVDFLSEIVQQLFNLVGV